MQRRIIYIGLFFLVACNNNPGTPESTPPTPVTKAPNPENIPVVSTARGMELFQQRCIACHGPGGNYRNNNAADLQVSKIDSISIVNTIINGKGAMPMFNHVMPDSDLAQLELYVKTLRK